MNQIQKRRKFKTKQSNLTLLTNTETRSEKIYAPLSNLSI